MKKISLDRIAVVLLGACAATTWMSLEPLSSRPKSLSPIVVYAMDRQDGIVRGVSSLSKSGVTSRFAIHLDRPEDRSEPLTEGQSDRGVGLRRRTERNVHRGRPLPSWNLRQPTSSQQTQRSVHPQ